MRAASAGTQCFVGQQALEYFASIFILHAHSTLCDPPHTPLTQQGGH